MNVFKKINGLINSFFQIGGPTAPAIKSNGTAIEHRLFDDSGFAVARAANPVGANDVVNLAYLATFTPVGTTFTDRFAITNAAAQSSATNLPAGAVVTSVKVQIDTPFSAGGTISVGQTGSIALLMATSDSFPQTAGIYEVDLDQAWGAAPLPVLVTVGGAPAAGAGFVITEYSIPNA